MWVIQNVYCVIGLTVFYNIYGPQCMSLCYCTQQGNIRTSIRQIWNVLSTRTTNLEQLQLRLWQQGLWNEEQALDIANAIIRGLIGKGFSNSLRDGYLLGDPLLRYQRHVQIWSIGWNTIAALEILVVAGFANSSDQDKLYLVYDSSFPYCQSEINLVLHERLKKEKRQLLLILT